MAVKSLVSINLSDGQDAFLICMYEPEQKLHITLLDLNECKAFSGYATDLDLRSQAATIQMAFNEFVSLSKKALLQIERDKEHFLYSLEKNRTEIVFKWKSVDEEETVIDIGRVKLLEKDYGTMIKDIFSQLSKEILTLNKRVLTLDKELIGIKKDKDEASQLLSKAIDMKELVEKELYSKFILVLNEKKQKIRELKRETCDSSPSNAKFSKDNKKRSKLVHQISESDDEATDDARNVDLPRPSTSKHNNSFPFLDDDESGQLKISPSKRRNRNKTAVNKTLNLLESKSSFKDITMDSESEDELFKNL